MENPKTLGNLTPFEISSIWPKTTPITLLLPLSLLYFILMALQPSHLSLYLNSSLRLLLITLPWMVLGSFLLLFLPLTISCFCLEWSAVIFSMSSEGLWTWFGPPYCSQKLYFRDFTMTGRNLLTPFLEFYLFFLHKNCLYSACGQSNFLIYHSIALIFSWSRVLNSSSIGIILNISQFSMSSSVWLPSNLLYCWSSGFPHWVLIISFYIFKWNLSFCPRYIKIFW